MTELKAETVDVRTETLDVPGASLAYDVRAAEGESTEPVRLMIGSSMDPTGFTTLERGFPGPDRRDVRPAWGLAQRADRRRHAVHAGGARGRPAPVDLRARSRANGHLCQQRGSGQRARARGPASGADTHARRARAAGRGAAA